MSGIEVAGLVLGAFPLLISALEHYRDTAEVLRIFWKIKREYKQWVHDLRISELAFERNLETLLLPLVVDDEEVQELLKNPGGPRWQDPELEGRLKQRLSKSYNLYFESISRIQEVMEELKKELGVDKLGFQTKTNLQPNTSLDRMKENLHFQIQRIRMSFSKSIRDSLFAQLTKGNDELRGLLDTSDQTAKLRQSRGLAKKTAETKGMWQFWRHTDKLYKLLTRSWLCECKQFHLANLLLQYRTSATPDFHILFFFGNYSKAAKPPWTCQEARIRMLEHDGDDLKPNTRSAVKFAPDPVPSPSPAPAVTTTAPTASPPTRAALRSPSPILSSSSEAESKKQQIKSLVKSVWDNFRKKGSVALVSDALLASPQTIQPADSAPSTNASTAAASATVAAIETPEPSQLIVTNADDNSNQERVEVAERMIEIINLCDKISEFPSKAEDGQPFCLKDDHYRVALHPVCHSRPATASAAAWDTISLEALLMKDTPRTLTRRERYLIALTLASSYLQLKSSPWIRPEWSKSDILFLRSGPSPSSIKLDHPYISRHFEGADKAKDGDGDDDIVVPMDRFDRNDRTLVSLGIMLLELCFGTALEEHETRRKYCYLPPSPGEAAGAAANPFFDMAAALEWSPHAAEEAGPEFADAIEWCLTTSGKGNGRLDRWREELFEKVVLPLKYCHDQFILVRN